VIRRQFARDELAVVLEVLHERDTPNCLKAGLSWVKMEAIHRSEGSFGVTQNIFPFPKPDR
jgi:hypothetical protein